MKPDPTWPHGQQPTRAPITLADAGCPGHRDRISNTRLPLCGSCERYGAAGPQIQPAAEQISGEWVCRERRSNGHAPEERAGLVPETARDVVISHASDFATPDLRGSGLGLGGSSIGGNAGGGVIA